jgi:F0F1-type ATP synthase gamma subunit
MRKFFSLLFSSFSTLKKEDDDVKIIVVGNKVIRVYKKNVQVF